MYNAVMGKFLIGTFLGKIALAIREHFFLLQTAMFYPERVGTIANDHLAVLLVTALCRTNKVFIDVGVHIGSITAAVIDRDKSVGVIGIEAMPEKINFLRKKFPSITLHGCAAGNTNGEVSFFINEKQTGYSSLIRQHGTIKEIRIPIRRMDDIISSDQVDVVKIDVEGAELGVLQGSENLVTKNRPTILFESAPATTEGALEDKAAIWEWFNARSYAVLVPNRVAHNNNGLSKEGFLESHFYPRRTTNYFAVPQERRTEIMNAARRILKLTSP